MNAEDNVLISLQELEYPLANPVWLQTSPNPAENSLVQHAGIAVDWS